jgi:son of sevenless
MFFSRETAVPKLTENPCRYNLTAVPGIQKFINDNLVETRTDNDLYQQSLLLEPREREDERIARLLQESGFL